jgi:hypothetical protein
MRASPAILASAYSFAHQESPPSGSSSSLLRGRWTCTISESVEGGAARAMATGLLDVLHAGCYLVGSGWVDRTRAEGAGPGAAALPSAGLEGPLFGAVRGDEVVLWVTNVFRTAMWVLKGELSANGRVIMGTAVYTDSSRGRQWSYEASFILSST